MPCTSFNKWKAHNLMLIWCSIIDKMMYLSVRKADLGITGIGSDECQHGDVNGSPIIVDEIQIERRRHNTWLLNRNSKPRTSRCIMRCTWMKGADHLNSTKDNYLLGSWRGLLFAYTGVRDARGFVSLYIAVWLPLYTPHSLSSCSLYDFWELNNSR